MASADRQKRMRLSRFLRDAELARPGASEAISEVIRHATDLRATLTGLPQLASEGFFFVRFGDQVSSINTACSWKISTSGSRSGLPDRWTCALLRQVVVNPERKSLPPGPDSGS
jgi:hypothetical protein